MTETRKTDSVAPAGGAPAATSNTGLLSCTSFDDFNRTLSADDHATKLQALMNRCNRVVAVTDKPKVHSQPTFFFSQPNTNPCGIVVQKDGTLIKLVLVGNDGKQIPGTRERVLGPQELREIKNNSINRITLLVRDLVRGGQNIIFAAAPAATSPSATDSDGNRTEQTDGLHGKVAAASSEVVDVRVEAPRVGERVTATSPNHAGATGGKGFVLRDDTAELLAKQNKANVPPTSDVNTPAADGEANDEFLRSIDDLKVE